MTNVILCGGGGTRLWPLSRTLMPKQFIKFFDNRSLFQLTASRNSKLCKKQLVVTNREQYFLSLDQLEEIGKENNCFLLEPIGRDTAAAIALACLSLNGEEIVLVTPSDHLIKNEDEYSKVVNKAKELAIQNNLVTLGIIPNTPTTEFGYIKANGYDVEAFHEKPNAEVAKKYLEDGSYYWNSGMFCFKAKVFLDELKKYSLEIFDACNVAYKNAKLDKKMIKINYEDMLNIPNNSIDYAVMEKSNCVKVVPSDIDWSDLGSFDALYDELPKDNRGNSLNENHMSIDSNDNLVYGGSSKIVTVDINNSIIVNTGDAILISKKGSSQKIKEIVGRLKEENSELHKTHLTTYRPWGTYTILENFEKYKIKRIVVKPGERLSLQKHFHRSEHWIVVSGTATVTVGDKIKLIRPNESTYIKMGEVHRLENEGKIPVVLIEVQVGEYTNENDIIRFDDDYNRD